MITFSPFLVSNFPTCCRGLLIFQHRLLLFQRNSDTLTRFSAHNSGSNSTVTLACALSRPTTPQPLPTGDTTSLASDTTDSGELRRDTNESGFVDDCDQAELGSSTGTQSPQPPGTVSPPPGFLNVGGGIPVIRIQQPDTIPEHDELPQQCRTSLFASRLLAGEDESSTASPGAMALDRSRRCSMANGNSGQQQVLQQLALHEPGRAATAARHRRYSVAVASPNLNLIITDPLEAAAFTVSLRRTIPRVRDALEGVGVVYRVV